jgi:hypothetical protein
VNLIRTTALNNLKSKVSPSKAELYPFICLLNSCLGTCIQDSALFPDNTIVELYSNISTCKNHNVFL